MAFYSLLDGNVTLSEHDIAEELFKNIESKSFLKVRGAETDLGVGLTFIDDKDRNISVSETETGLYLIYKKGDFNQYECLYAGAGNIRYRIYRFIKELFDKSRDDESHSAAKKVRRLNLVSTNEELYVKYISQAERDSIVVNMLCSHLRLKNIDEHIAHIAKSVTNKRIKKA